MVLRDCDSACTSCADPARHGHDPVLAHVDEILRDKLKTGNLFRHLFDDPTPSRVAAMRPAHERHDLYLGIPSFEHCVEIPAIARLYQPAHDLDVLRHRLPLEAEVGERVLAVE